MKCDVARVLDGSVGFDYIAKRSGDGEGLTRTREQHQRQRSWLEQPQEIVLLKEQHLRFDPSDDDDVGGGTGRPC